MRKKMDIFPLFVKNLEKKRRPYISEPAQGYKIDKICKTFCGVLQAGHQGANP